MLPPSAECDFVGKASASASEPSPNYANKIARKHLAERAERLGGNYVELTSVDTKAVDVVTESAMVRLEGRVYKCPDSGDDAGTSGSAASAMVAGGASDRLGGDAGAVVIDPRAPACNAPAELRPLDPAEGLGWQCARNEAGGWVADGPYLLRWNSGATQAEGSFDNGKRSGVWSFYYANGQLRERATFRYGQLEGCAQEFDADGHTLSPRCAGADAADGSDGR